MSPIVDGQRVWAATDNAAFLDAQQDDVALGKIGLHNTDPDSGLFVDNTQKWINHLIQDNKIFVKPIKFYFDLSNNEISFSEDIEIVFRDTNVVNTVSSANSPITILDNESVYVTINRNANTNLSVNVSSTLPKTKDTFRICTRINDKIIFFDNSFIKANSSGTIGDLIDRDKVPLEEKFLKFYLSSVTGSSVNINSEMSGYSASLSATQKGIIVNAPYNKVIIKNNSNSDKNNFFTDADGNVVYGRVTYSAPNWTLSFYTLVNNVETPYSFSNNDIVFYIKGLFDRLTDSPVYDESISDLIENFTENVIDADQTRKGKVNLQNANSLPISNTSSIGTPNARVANADHTHAGIHSIQVTGDVNPALLGDVEFEAGTNISLTKLTQKIKIDNTFTLPLNAKGDLLTHDGSSTQKLPVGTNGQVLTADSTSPLGVKWADVVGSGGSGALFLRQLSSNAAIETQFGIFPVYEFQDELDQSIHFLLKVPFNFNPAKKIKLFFLSFADSNSTNTYSFSITTSLYKVNSSIDTASSIETTSVSASSNSVNRRLNESNVFLTSVAGQVGSVSFGAGDLLLIEIKRSAGDSEISNVYLISESLAIDLNA